MHVRAGKICETWKACKKGEKTTKGKGKYEKENHETYECTRQRHKRPNMHRKARENQGTFE